LSFSRRRNPIQRLERLLIELDEKRLHIYRLYSDLI
jgi:hypothetical protein